MRLIIARHCQTDWNALEKIQGRTDIPLNDAGRQQARELARSLKELDLSRVITSPLLRAKETAEIIAREHQVDLLLDKRLEDLSFGRFEGHHFSILDPIAPRNVFPYDLRPHGGEHYEGILERQLNLLREMEHDSDEHVLIVGHGRSLNTLLHGLKREERVQQGSFIVIEGSYLKSFLSNEDSE
ncbi:histidine phosphatase family protein [Candidatus Uhrbacteria bacterium]|nr:histidine phosphatase family protein [Candidatus Uhrbacteria bacterium]